MSAPLNIYAGPGALATIKNFGFSPHIFNHVIGASGGPKWFVLAGLDRVLFPEWLSRKSASVNVIGSSAGAFRAACMAQNDSRAAINRLAESYSQTTYSDKPTSAEITHKARELLDYVLGESGAEELVANKRVIPHIFVARCHGLMERHTRLPQLAGLTMSAAVNALNRRRLQKYYTRYVFSPQNSFLRITDPYELNTQFAVLDEENVSSVLLASGSIPAVLDGVSGINSAPEGVFRDGGILDYHFDIGFQSEPGLVLYPHFYRRPVTGWFDKPFRRRLVHASSYHNVVMLVPSDEFVASLPYQKIPDRKDFETLDAQTRIKYWQTVLSETDRLGDYFMKITQDGSIMNKIRPLPFASYVNDADKLSIGSGRWQQNP